MLAGCTPSPRAARPPVSETTPEPKPEAPPTFSGDRALALLRTWLTHSRALGDPARTASIDALAKALRDAGSDHVHRLPFEALDPQEGSTYPLENLIAHVRPEAPRRFILATHFDGMPLTPDHGYPLRGVAGVLPGRRADDKYFWKGGKWLRGLEFTADDKPGFWERNGYHNQAGIWLEQRHGWPGY